MREIKFRAWNETKSCWYHPIYEAYKNNLFDLMVGFSGDLLAHTMRGVEHESVFTEKYILEQYTGLKDKNGKEIYEGDILQWENGYAHMEFYTRVEFYEGSFISRHSTGLKYNIKKLDDGGGSSYDFKVIGNIHENPELLNA